MMVGIAASIWTYLHGLPGPIVATIGLVVFTLCVVLWRAFQMAKAGTLYTQEFRAVKAPYQGVLTVKLIKPVWWQRVLNSLGNWRKKT